jgi:hypothetical protein
MPTAAKTVAAEQHATARTNPSRKPGEVASPDTPRPGGVVSPAPVLITEQEVMLGTAAATAGALPGTSTGGWIAVLRRLFAPSADRRPARRHYPPRRPSWMEEACMAREMDRL